MQQKLDEVNKELSPLQPEGKKLIRQVTVTFNENKDAFETGSHVATISADLLSGDFRATRPAEIMALWREKTGDLPDIIDLKFDEPTVGPAGAAIDLRLKGDDLKELKQASSALVQWLRRYEGVTSVLDDLRPGKREIRIHLKEGAVTLGITASLVADQLRAAYFGIKISELQVDGEAFEVNVRLAADDRNSLADFDNFTISLPGGVQVPISTVASLEFGRGYARINRQDGMRTVTVQGTIDGRVANANDIVKDTLARFIPDLVKRYPGVKVTVEGQNKEARTTQKSMVKGFMIGLVGVFLVLSFQFRSYIEPLVVMVVIPFALIGAIFGHMAMGLDFSMPSMLGFVALAGVVVNNSILLVSFIKVHHEEEGTVAKAAALASRKRFRAIFLTSLTTIVGLLPILSETSLQAQIMVPLVASLTFGLTASSFVVLFIVPAFYSILDDFGISTLSSNER
jgi:multidrug efflux pump subunit AcrB